MKKINWCKWFNYTWLGFCSISAFVFGDVSEGFAWMVAIIWCWLYFKSEAMADELFIILGAKDRFEKNKDAKSA